MLAAVAVSKVPKVTVIMGRSVGPAAYAMAGRSSSPHFCFMWPEARIALTEEALALPESTAIHASAQLWTDDVLSPARTRAVVAACFQACRSGVAVRPNANEPRPVFKF